LQASDESRYAEVSRETLSAHHWLAPRLNDVPHLTKSAFYNDLVAASFAAFGPTVFALRLVSILAFLAGVLCAVRWADWLGGRRAGVLCAWVSLTMAYPVAAGEFGDLNTLLTFLLTVGLLLVFAGLRPEGSAWTWFCGWGFLGLAFLTKGPPAFMVPAATLLLFRWIGGKPFRKPWSWWLGGCALFCVIGFSWYVWLLVEHGRTLWNFWVSDVMERTSANKSRKGVVYYLFYLPVFLGGSSGWGVWLLWRAYAAARWRKGAAGVSSWFQALLRAVRELPSAEQWALAWMVATLVCFAALRAYMIAYILPAFPAAALLLALRLARRPDEGHSRGVARMIQAAAAVTILGLWGGALGQYTLVHRGASPKSSPSETIEYNALARTMAAYRDPQWSLVECSFYNPLFPFLTRRNAVLCEANKESSSPWQPPANLTLSAEDLRSQVAAKRPLMILAKRSKVGRIFPEPMQGVRVLAEGPTMVLLTDLP
jgi:4-amino-4-deoxy-L-arabinose transferase